MLCAASFVGAVGGFMPLLIGSGDARTQGIPDGNFLSPHWSGIIQSVELTGSFPLFLPMLAAAFAALKVASLAKCPPACVSLRMAH